ncbi:DegT/DnrJ/EryC1/StrS aminotransferase family protein [Tenacibaculum sp. SG-28]|uniref:DegT/DnrJ/EryC1/StrS family aminotransferase n=1 Tax=Tenacibaculum sp. SG-28 TaxID=754426 RepID=UPI000CF45252|nr:DegT/DnrJ/EryC1/StrS family aminotransferase [Tenacibaculum sp. SG-28]PQJ21105.1 aminotransferase [Tenacibaculum sp. SG-28]
MLRLSKSVIGIEEINAVTKVLENEYLGMGDNVKEFEELLSSYFNRPTVCVNTGTSAIHLALQSLGVDKGDEVLVQSLTYVATYQAISATGAKPISCEINPKTLTIDLEDAKRKLTPKTKVILPVHYGGGVGDLNKLYIFAKENNLRVVEDAAHAFGSIYKDKLVGAFGDICCFSFDGIKNITSGEGGAILTDDKTILERIKDARLLGVQKDTDKRYSGKRSWEFDVEFQGWRYHMSNIMAAIGVEQFKKFPGFKAKRQDLAKLYQTEFSNIERIKILDHNYQEIVPHIFTIQVDSDQRDELKEFLSANGVQTGFHYFPNHLLSKFKIQDLNLPLTEKLHKNLITLPLHPDLDEEDVKKVSKLIKDFLKV